jgi:TyrR family helix-turn-helix protein
VVEGDYIRPEDLPAHITDARAAPGGKTLPEVMEEVERELIVRSYRDLGSSYKVAQKLGISQSSACRKINKYCFK